MPVEDNLNYQMFFYKIDSELELKRENLELLSELKHGNFSVVFKGRLRACDGEIESFSDVAVKTTSNNASTENRDMLLNEANIMKGFNSKHIVKLLGIVADNQRYFIVMELMANQDLKTFLIENQPFHKTLPEHIHSSPPKSFPAVADMAIQIADGMAYLTYKRFVHRDLAARNCMVGADRTIKIGDFGMTQDIYWSNYYRMGSKKSVPVRWMAPESLNNRIFTSESDVFSYGIVLWEIVTFAKQPYKQVSDEKVIEHITTGRTEERPEQNCSDKMFELMKKCWKFNPRERITFIEIIENLLDEAPKSFFEDSFYSKRTKA